MCLIRIAPIVATILAIAVQHGQAAISVTTTRVRSTPEEENFISLDNTFISGNAVGRFNGLVTPQSGTFALQSTLVPLVEQVDIPITVLSDVTFEVRDPTQTFGSSGGFPLETLEISILDTDLGEIGTIEVIEDLSVGTLTQRAIPGLEPSPFSSFFTLSGFVSDVSFIGPAPPNAVLVRVHEDGAFIWHFQRQIGQTSYDITFLGFGTRTDVSAGVPLAPPRQALGMRVTVTNPVPEPTTLTLFGVGGAICVFASWRRRKVQETQRTSSC